MTKKIINIRAHDANSMGQLYNILLNKYSFKINIDPLGYTVYGVDEHVYTLLLVAAGHLGEFFLSNK